MKRWATLIAAAALTLGTARADMTAVGLDRTQYTSDFMIGNVVVAVVFPESNGGIDPNVENWSSDRQAAVLSEIMNGLDWWTHQNPRSPVSFTVVSQTVPTKYEPITRPYYDEALWIPDVMSHLGYNGSRFSSTRAYINDLRAQYHADWGYVIFVVDSLLDANGKFADGYFAYSYLGGPFTVMTYDNNGYGITNMDVVCAHETGHIFNALDEYAGASGPSDYSHGYFPTINGNHQYSTIANSPDSIMRGGIRWGLDDWARQMIGWRDADNNGRDDIVDRPPVVNYASQQSSQGNVFNFSGNASVGVLPRQGNTQGFGLTVDTIARVEYKQPDGSWGEAAPVDGNFNSGTEAFAFNVNRGESSTQGVNTQSVDLRVVTEYSLNATAPGGGVVPSGPGALSNAHPFPNPFKPNSGLGHTNGITFSGLTPGARVQIFTPTGDPVFDKTLDSTVSSLQWNAVNDNGENLASGVYLYLITDGSGNKKDGKFAIVR
jgi:hypothetical protein